MTDEPIYTAPSFANAESTGAALQLQRSWLYSDHRRACGVIAAAPIPVVDAVDARRLRRHRCHSAAVAVKAVIRHFGSSPPPDWARRRDHVRASETGP